MSVCQICGRRAAWGGTGSDHADCLRAQLATVTRERDEARAMWSALKAEWAPLAAENLANEARAEAAEARERVLATAAEMQAERARAAVTELSGAVRLLREREYDWREAMCLSCHSQSHRPHRKGCPLAAFLARHPEAP